MVWTGRELLLAVSCLAASMLIVGTAHANSRGDELAEWINQRGEQVWGPPPPQCDDLTFARRLYFDLLGRPPGVAELQDFERLSPDTRRRQLIEQLVFSEGDRKSQYERQSSLQFARQWRHVLLPGGAGAMAGVQSIDNWLAQEYRNSTPYDQIMRQLVVPPNATATSNRQSPASASAAALQYYQLLGGLPENYAANVSRVMLGVRIECAQCHDHPFTAWKLRDFWGLAAFYSDMGRAVDDASTSQSANTAGTIVFQNVTYRAKLLWSDQPLDQEAGLRSRLGRWMTSAENPNFASTAVNRFWQHLVGRGLVVDVDNLDQAEAAQRRMLDEFGQRFAASGYSIQRLMAAICKSNWYQAISQSEPESSDEFYRPLKAISPEQVFDAMEQSLHLSISRVDPQSPRWSGGRGQLVSRLSESGSRSPDEYSAGIPQALLMMNGSLTEEAIGLEKSRLLRAVVESPFLGENDRVETLFLSLITRRPTPDERQAIDRFLESKPDEQARKTGMGELVWALLNSPEFVLCR